jgi:chromate transporter
MAIITSPEERAAPPPPTLGELFRLFCQIGLTSFGGGTSTWIYHQIVHVKRWVDEDEFFDAWALCQALPGVNVTNLAVWMGRRLLGWKGVLSALAGIVLLPAILIILIAALFGTVAHYSITIVVLTGATAAAIALPFSMGITLASRVRRAAVPLGLMVATFLAVGIFKVPLVWVVLIFGGTGVAAEYLRLDKA